MALKRKVPTVQPAKAVPKSIPKGVPSDAKKAAPAKEQPKPESKAAPRKRATKPTVPARSVPTASGPEPAATAASTEAEHAVTARTSAKPPRLTQSTMRSLSIEERFKLSKRLNAGVSEDFIPLLMRSELPKKHGMRLLEAQKREIISAAPPRVKNIEVYFCPYCVDWMPFVYSAWTGYTKCCGCSISTKDFYTSADNKLFNKE